MKFPQDFANLFLVFFFILGVYQDVVDIADTELVEVFSQGIINESLGSGWGIG